MRHLTVCEFGSFLGISGERLVVKIKDEVIKEYPLSRIRTISITKRGVSVSGDLILSCSVRGIKIFFLDWRNRIASAVVGQNQHAVVNLRKLQFEKIRSNLCCLSFTKSVMTTKIKNQRAVVLYFTKNKKRKFEECSKFAEILNNYESLINTILQQFKSYQIVDDGNDEWRNFALGLEGRASTAYWKCLQNLNLLPLDFNQREGYKADSITNKALNYGYAILTSYVWSALDNSGLEVYAGFLHTDRPGKPSLVLDMMEEYRAWVVDRNVIKMRSQLSSSKDFNFKLKKLISNLIHETMGTRYLYKKKKLKLENILQRQIYRFSGCFAGTDSYKGYVFKW